MLRRFSACDVAGAILWTVLAAWLWWDIAHDNLGDRAGQGMLWAIPMSFGSLYCIARLLGARE